MNTPMDRDLADRLTLAVRENIDAGEWGRLLGALWILDEAGAAEAAFGANPELLVTLGRVFEYASRRLLALNREG